MNDEAKVRKTHLWKKTVEKNKKDKEERETLSETMKAVFAYDEENVLI